MAAQGDTSEEDEAFEEEEAAALMAISESDSNSDCELIESLSQLKDKVRGLSKAKIEELLVTLMDECDAMNAENCMLKDVCSELKKDVNCLKRTSKNQST